MLMVDPVTQSNNLAWKMEQGGNIFTGSNSEIHIRIYIYIGLFILDFLKVVGKIFPKKWILMVIYQCYRITHHLKNKQESWSMFPFFVAFLEWIVSFKVVFLQLPKLSWGIHVEMIRGFFRQLCVDWLRNPRTCCNHCLCVHHHAPRSCPNHPWHYSKPCCRNHPSRPTLYQESEECEVVWS